MLLWVFGMCYLVLLYCGLRFPVVSVGLWYAWLGLVLWRFRGLAVQCL